MQQIILYQKKLSGPILDRIDIHVSVPPVPVADLANTTAAEPSQTIRTRVIAARERQIARYKALGITANSQLSNKDILTYANLEPESTVLLHQAIDRFKLSARGYHKVIKLARTIADLDGAETIPTTAVAEALQYRPSS